jgi:hypothetical protein
MTDWTGAAGNAFVLPNGLLTFPYHWSFSFCGDAGADVTLSALSPLPPGIDLNLSPAGLSGVPTKRSDGGLFEFEIGVTSPDGGMAYQNFLMMVDQACL